MQTFWRTFGRMALAISLCAFLGFSTYAASLPQNIKDLLDARSLTIGNSNDWNISTSTSNLFEGTLLQNGILYEVRITMTNTLEVGYLYVWNFRLDSRFIWLYGGAPGDNPSDGWTFGGSVPIHNHPYDPFHEWCPN